MSLPKTYRQWVYAKPMENNVLDLSHRGRIDQESRCSDEQTWTAIRVWQLVEFYADCLAPAGASTLRQAFGISPEIEALLADRGIATQCWIVDKFYHERLLAENELSRLMTSGDLKPINTVVHDFEMPPDAIVGPYRQSNRFGKLQVDFGDR